MRGVAKVRGLPSPRHEPLQEMLNAVIARQAAQLGQPAPLPEALVVTVRPDGSVVVAPERVVASV